MTPPAASTTWHYSDDIVLVAAAQRGERDAMNALLERHYDRIATVVRRIVANAADAADATQEALISLARGIVRFDGQSSFATWSYRVATNAALDELRRKGRRPTPTDDVTVHVDSQRPANPFADVDATADLERALSSIPADFRAPLVLRDVCGLDYAEIAEILSIPGGTVRSRIARARAALAPHLRVLPEPEVFPQPSGNQIGASERPRIDHVD